MLNVKSMFLKILTFMQSPIVQKSSGTVSSTVKRSDTNKSVTMRVESTKQGLYLDNYNKYLIHAQTAGGDIYIADMNLTTLVITRQKTVSINKAAGSSTSITADTVNYYNFKCWLQPATTGWIGSVYTENPATSSTKIFNATTGQSGTGNVLLTAVYTAKVKLPPEA